ncbi:hypothetical protein L211DRAFT_178951 [Terfezia boudieri ATCC MYA-4762]|uniref:RING-type domain-containing protein n=1 Tax=Terfezia boudieri ATCC MYA-4762 TaxID=1051890 RepID=A0A3N4LSV1_9PEZI|nr:hypothetical protein L211DRAFT_178951 [Terfezia boudieri ATCC MYA-4762]
MFSNFFSSIAHASSSSSSPGTSGAPADDVGTELNEYLEILAQVFPEADVDDIRDRLLKSSDESRLYLVTESLLIIPSKGARPNARASLEPAEKFRSQKYQTAVKKLLQNEFKGLSKSTIQAVMMETNHDYRKSRATLTRIAAKSWRFSVSAFFRRKKAEAVNVVCEQHATGCEELDAELRELGMDKIEAQIAEDRKISALLDEAEHAAASELIGCETCYGDYSWNEIAACSVGHFICHGCLKRSVQENLYGQGQSMMGAKSSIRCISAAASPICDACIPPEILANVIPEDMLQAMEEKVATENLDHSGMSLVRCPFCSYAEADELQPYCIRQWAKVCGILVLLMLYIYIPEPVFSTLAPLFLFTYFITPFLPRDSSGIVLDTIKLVSLHRHWQNAVRRIQLKRRGTLFKCRNERCKRESCIGCSKEWTAFHKCFEKEEDSMRIYVEKAMANAVKRTCPVCRISFVKADGCNKLTCVCGYIMCYICRADIGNEGYKHFCQHFRQVPGTACVDCDKCDLYVQEDEEAAIRDAAIKAEKEYFRNYDIPTTWQYNKDKIGPIRLNNSLVWLDLSKLRKYFDLILEKIIADVRDPTVPE